MNGMLPSLFLSAFGLGVAYSVLPGAVTTETLRRGVLLGFRSVLKFRLGALLGNLAWAGVALSGAGFLLQSTPARLVLGLGGTALLLRMAWGTLTASANGPRATDRAYTARGDLLTGTLIALANPLALAFWLGISAQVTAGTTGSWASRAAAFLAGFSLAHLLCTAVFAVIVAGGPRLGGARFLRRVSPLCCAALVYFGVRLFADTLLGA